MSKITKDKVDLFYDCWEGHNQVYELDVPTLVIMQSLFTDDIYISPCEYADVLEIRFEEGLEVDFIKLKNVLGGEAIMLKKVELGFDGLVSYRVGLNPKWVEKVELGKDLYDEIRKEDKGE